jgi:nicotinate phosphoribosyltransferase
MDITRSGLYTDFYELTMAQGYFCSGKINSVATFDLYFRSAPFSGGYGVFAGLEQAVHSALAFSYTPDDIAWLRSLAFHDDFLDWLAAFRFSGDIDAFREGDIVFPDDILIRITAPIIEAQLLESMLLNIINFQTLIATKTMRIVSAARGRSVMDFGLRRAQAEGSMAATRAAFIGGAIGTSNTRAAKEYGIPVMGTHAHSWIQSFESEYEAFRTYAALYPQATTLLVDTYDTLSSGMPNAIRVAREMEARGEKLGAIRLDSGDMAYLSKKARALLDEAGLDYVRIVASNQLDEHLIESLLDQQAPIDVFGVGTRLICSYDQPALDGIYKMSCIDGKPTIKFSENPEKINSPGKKKVIRYMDNRGKFLIDALILDDEQEATLGLIRHSTIEFHTTAVDRAKMQPDAVFFPVVRGGRQVAEFPSLQATQSFACKRFALLPDEHKRFANPHVYRVGLSEKLYLLRHELIRKKFHHA